MKKIYIILFLAIGFFAFQEQASAQSINFGKLDLEVKTYNGWFPLYAWNCAFQKPFSTGRAGRYGGALSATFSIELRNIEFAGKLNDVYRKGQIIERIEIDLNKAQLVTLEGVRIAEMNMNTKTSAILFLETKKVKFSSNKQETGWDFQYGRSY